MVVALLLLVHLVGLVAQPTPEACCFGNGRVVYGRDCYEDFPLVVSWDDVYRCWQLGAHHFSNKSSAEEYQIFSIILGSQSSFGFTKSRHSNSVVHKEFRYSDNVSQIVGNGSALVMDSSVVASNLSLSNPMLPLFIQFVFPVQESTGAKPTHQQ